MRQEVTELAAEMGLDNVDILEDASTLTGRRRNAKGFYNRRTGKIKIVLSNNLSVEDARSTLLHEAVGHHGLRKLLESDLHRCSTACMPRLRRACAGA